MKLKELDELNNYGTDKQSTHHYLDIYDRLFKPFQYRRINLLEVGIAKGGSLRLWEHYFPEAIIYGVDILDEIQYLYGGRVYVHHIDFKDIEIQVKLDIAIDDGSHLVSDQIEFIKLVWPSMRKGGLLIIEDVFDIDNVKKEFDVLDIPYEIIDLRKETGSPDSVLLIFRK
jgi:hypothetical protein